MGNPFSRQDYIQPDYEEYLGRGSFGFVYKGTYGEQAVAVKAINRHMLKDKYHNTDKNELIPFLKGLKHPNVISIIAWEDKGHELWLALELCHCGLDKFVAEHDLSDCQTCNILQQAAHGVSYLHKRNIIHRDIRPDNMLILLDNKISRPLVKLTDFSLCKDIDDQAGSTMTTVWGNPNWLAPELLDADGRKAAANVRYKRSIDVFSFGLVVLYVCVTHAGRDTINRTCWGTVVKSGQDMFVLLHDLWRSEGLRELFLPLARSLCVLAASSRPAMLEVASLHMPQGRPRLQHRASHYLQGYEGQEHVGIGGENYVLVGCEDTNSLHLLKLADDASAYEEVWRKECAVGEGYDDRKYVLDESFITRDWVREPTKCWDLNMRLLHTHDVGRRVELMGCLAPHTIVYADKVGPDNYQLILHDGDQEVTTLRAPDGSTWYSDLSICRHPASGLLAVCDSSTWSLHVFDADGTHLYRTKLGYMPQRDNAIACTESHVFVNKGTKLHVHAWSGGHQVGTVDLSQLVQLGEMEKTVVGIGVCRGRAGDTLHVAVGCLFGVVSVHAFGID